MAADRTSFPARRAAAARNRDKIVDAARDAFADAEADISMAEVARRAGVGMATLYRNFPGRRELLEALYADEVDALCAAAEPGEPDQQAPGAALVTWLRRLFAFVPGKRLVVSELLEHTDQDGAALRGHRVRALEAGRPLLTAAQHAGEVRDDVTIEQIFDMIAAIAKIHGAPDYLAPIFEMMLDGLRGPTSGEPGTRVRAAGARRR